MVEIMEGHMMSEHVHLLVEIPSRISVSSFMEYWSEKVINDIWRTCRFKI